MKLDKFEERKVGKILDHIIDQSQPDEYTAPNTITVLDASKKI